jgi:hypothetical protein
MDLDKVIRELHQDLKKIDLVIESLEELISTGTVTAGSHSGRKSMAEEERRMVSKRMKKYWASRRKPRS